ncbi:MAG TPA: C25 family cysteine peptidase, partial [bacterium]
MKKLLLSIAFLCGLSISQDLGARYLIITHDNYYDAILPLAQWKHKKGMRTKVVKLSAIGSTSTAIKNYIVNAYNNWQVKPEYLLLVGAPNYLPFPQVGGVYTDNYYTNMDGDIYNEILSGRLTVHNTTEAQAVVAKMLKYERAPLITDSLWFKKACLIVNEEGNYAYDTIYWNDAKYVANRLVANGYVYVDTFSRNQGDDYNSVINAANQGRDFVLYRGNATNNWYMPFNVNPDNLANGEKLPIVVSATCGTLGTGGTPATAERWFLTGSPTNLRGASGYFATTTSGYNLAHLRSAVARGFFDGIFVNKCRTFGQACENGRIRVYQTYGSYSEFYGFTTIGDPEMNIWTSNPKPIVVVHDTVLFPNINDTMNVQVFKQGTAVESAYVCIIYDTVLYQTAYTDINGSASFYFTLPDTGHMDITVTGRNLYPYEGQIPVACNSAYLAYDHNTINDSLGDDDGQVDPGETILLWATVHNMSPITAEGVAAYLRTNDTLVFLGDSVSMYGTIPGGNLSSGLNPFICNVSSHTDSHAIDFSIVMKDAYGDTWGGNFSIITTGEENGGGTGPDPYGYYIYDDTDSASGNEPGYDWFEIAAPTGGPGSIIPEITDEDADTVTIPLPFTFNFYGITYDSIGISSNGIVELGAATYALDDNGPIPRPGRPKRLSASFWDDLDPSTVANGHGDIYQYYDAASHRWILEYYQVALGYGFYSWETFQVILRDPAYYPTPTGDGEFLYFYDSVSNVNSSTVGIEDETETRGLQYVFNGLYDKHAAVLQDGRALLVTTKPPVEGAHEPWLHLTGHMTGDSLGGDGDGVLEPGETVQVALTVANGGDTLAGSVSGTVRTASSSVVPVDSLADFGRIAAGGAAGNMTDPFEITIAANPVDTVVGCVVHFVCNGG